MIEVVPTEDWDRVLDDAGGADVYWRSAYVRAAAEMEGGRPVLLRYAADGVIFIALVIRDNGEAATPYGYGGPLVASGGLAGFWGALDRWCASNGVTSLFVRLHPLYPVNAPGSRVAGATAVLPCQGALLEQMHPRHRNKVRKAQRQGIEVTCSVAPTDLSDFASIYDQTMARLGAGSVYRLSGRYWSLLLALGQRLVLCRARQQGETVAGAVFMLGNDWLHYHLSGSADDGRKSGASQLMIYAAAQWAQDRGFRGIHLGGGLGGGADTLLAFKHRFAPREPLRPYSVVNLNCGARRLVA